MPIYEYECNACGDRHEFIQKFSDAPKRKCPACGLQRLRKLVSAAAFHLKGSGWYVTDFRDKGKKKDGKSADTDSKSDTGDAKSDTGSEGKADAASKSTPESSSESKPGKEKKVTSKKADSSASSAP